MTMPVATDATGGRAIGRLGGSPGGERHAGSDWPRGCGRRRAERHHIGGHGQRSLIPGRHSVKGAGVSIYNGIQSTPCHEVRVG